VKPWLAYLPDDESLTAALAVALGDRGGGSVAILDRLRNPHASAFPSEVVSCRLNDRQHLRLFCKYGGGRDHGAHGHRGGVSYEADVYRRVLAPAGLPVPRFYGTATGPCGEVWLFLGYLERCCRLRDSDDVRHLELAAAWSGRCHGSRQVDGDDGALSFVNAYHAGYYAGWARRTVEYASAIEGDFAWLPHLWQRAEAALARLLEAPQILIHGEYYSKNLLVCDGAIYPVDWESAARAPGEIDLATLTDGWEQELVERCQHAYCAARWPDGTPPEFTRTFDIARLYVHFRWLGDQPGHKLRRRFWRYTELRNIGERLGLL